MGSLKMIVLDTHAWVWWVSESAPLPQRVTRLLSQAQKQNAVYISSISAWEVALLVKRGRLELTMDVQSWVSHSEALPFIHFVSVDNEIAIKSVNLPEPAPSDPADRIIIATALTLGFPVITKDEKITKYPHIRSIW